MGVLHASILGGVEMNGAVVSNLHRYDSADA